MTSYYPLYLDDTTKEIVANTSSVNPYDFQENIDVGKDAGLQGQQACAIAIGFQAGMINQGADSIAIGCQAGMFDQPSKSIILNASGEPLNAGNQGLYIAPLRFRETGFQVMGYDETTKELYYTNGGFQGLEGPQGPPAGTQGYQGDGGIQGNQGNWGNTLEEYTGGGNTAQPVYSSGVNTIVNSYYYYYANYICQTNKIIKTNDFTSFEDFSLDWGSEPLNELYGDIAGAILVEGQDIYIVNSIAQNYNEIFETPGYIFSENQNMDFNSITPPTDYRFYSVDTFTQPPVGVSSFRYRYLYEPINLQNSTDGFVLFPTYFGNHARTDFNATLVNAISCNNLYTYQIAFNDQRPIYFNKFSDCTKVLIGTSDGYVYVLDLGGGNFGNPIVEGTIGIVTDNFKIPVDLTTQVIFVDRQQLYCANGKIYRLDCNVSGALNSADFNVVLQDDVGFDILRWNDNSFITTDNELYVYNGLNTNFEGFPIINNYGGEIANTTNIVYQYITAPIDYPPYPYALSNLYIDPADTSHIYFTVGDPVQPPEGPRGFQGLQGAEGITFRAAVDTIEPTNLPTNLQYLGISSASDFSKLSVASEGEGNKNYNSNDGGESWTPSNTTIASGWYKMASSADGTTLVATALYDDYLYVSVDSGLNWVQRAFTDSWNAVTMSADGTKMAACVWNDYIYTSTDGGTNWNIQTSSTSKRWTSITSSSNGTKLAACVGIALFYGFDSDLGYIYTSTDSGVNWTQQTNSGIRNWQCITSNADGTKLAACVGGGQGSQPNLRTGYIYTSTNSGVNWTEQTDSGSREWTAIASSSNGNVLIACSLYQVYYSTDSGITWKDLPDSIFPNSSYRFITISSDGLKAAVSSGNGKVFIISLANPVPTGFIQSTFFTNPEQPNIVYYQEGLNPVYSSVQIEVSEPTDYNITIAPFEGISIENFDAEGNQGVMNLTNNNLLFTDSTGNYAEITATEILFNGIALVGDQGPQGNIGLQGLQGIIGFQGVGLQTPQLTHRSFYINAGGTGQGDSINAVLSSLSTETANFAFYLSTGGHIADGNINGILIQNYYFVGVPNGPDVAPSCGTVMYNNVYLGGNSTNTRGHFSNIQFANNVGITGQSLNRHYFNSCTFTRGFIFSSTNNANFIYFNNCEFAAAITIPNTSTQIIFQDCKFGGFAITNQQALSPLLVIFANCSSLPSFSLGLCTIAGQNATSAGAIRTDSTQYYQNGVLVNPFGQQGAQGRQGVGSVGTQGVQGLGFIGTQGFQGLAIPGIQGLQGVSQTPPFVGFSAYKTTNQTLTSNATTTITFQATEYNVGNYFNTTTSTFTPLVAGYYRISATAQMTTSNNDGFDITISVLKNSSIEKRGSRIYIPTIKPIHTFNAMVNTTMYFNGTTDNVIILGYMNSTTNNNSITASSTYTYFQAELIGV